MTQFADTFESGGLTNWPTITGNAAASTAAAYIGTYGTRLNPGGGVAGQIATSTTKWTQGTFTWGFVHAKFRIVTLPVGTTADLITLQAQTQVDNFDFYYNNTTGTFWFDLKGATAFTDTGLAPQVGHWYDFQARVFYGATTYTAEVLLDGQNLGLLSSPGETSSFVRSLHIGTSSTSKTFTFDVDNVVANVGTVQPEFEVYANMAKQSGLGDNLYVGGNDLSGDVSTVQISSPQAVQDVTGIDKSAMERIGLARDGNINWTSFWNPARAHPVLSALPTADVMVTYCRGTTLGNPAACQVSKQINYDGTRADSGEFTFSLQAQANAYGLEWGNQLTAGLRTDTGATNGIGYDTGASASFGAQAYLQVTAFTGTDVTIKIQDSADNLTFADVSGLAFTAVTAAPATQRLALSNTATVGRYVRAVTTTSGGFSSVTFSVVIHKNEIGGVVF